MGKRFDFITSPSFPMHHPLTCAMLDPQTIAISNLFGNFYISRLNKSSKFNKLVEFYVGDMITCIEKAKLSPLGKPLIVYATITGSIGCFVPFESQQNAQFFDALQYYLPSKLTSLSGQSHILFRSKFMPSKNCTDSDL